MKRSVVQVTAGRRGALCRASALSRAWPAAAVPADIAQPDASELVDVDFDFFNFGEIDYKALSLLLRQLFSHDAKEFEFGSLADFLIADNCLGSTVKCDGEESDPYAFAALLDLSTHAQHPAVSPIRTYLLQKATSAKGAQAIAALLQASAPEQPQEQHVGLILSERLLNMPPQITAPFLRILHDEMHLAEQQNLPFKIKNLLYLSRLFIPSPEDPEEDGVPAKKARKSAGGRANGRAAAQGFVPYHIEDEVIAEYATSICDFDFTNEPEPSTEPRRQDAFGVKEQGRLMLLSLDQLPKIIERLDSEASTAVNGLVLI